MKRLVEGGPLYDNAVIRENGEMRGLMLVKPNTVTCHISDDTIWVDARVETYVVSADYGELAICVRVLFTTNEYVNENLTEQYEISNRYYVIFPVMFKNYEVILKNSKYAKELMMRYLDEYFLQYSECSQDWDAFIEDKMKKEIAEYKKD